MSKRDGFKDERVMKAFRELNERFGLKIPIWFEVSVLLLYMCNNVTFADTVGIEKTLRRLKRNKLVQRKNFSGVDFYSLTKSARDKYLEE